MGRNYPWNYRPPQSAGPEVPKHRSSKDTKRWCKGVVGREHVWTWEPWKGDRSDRGVLVRICTKCRKELQIHWGRGNIFGWDRVTGQWVQRSRYYGPGF